MNKLKTMRINFKITNITCEACIKISQAVLRDLPGVTKADIKSDGSATIEADREVDWKEIKNALAEVDKNASLI
jgi:copper chaperone CopZ